MKVKKGNIELTIKSEDWNKYQKAGWSKKFERHPDVRRKLYHEMLKKEKVDGD